MNIQSDTCITGKLYPKLDSYVVLQRKECKGSMVYFGSSNQFKTQKAYREYLKSLEKWKHLTFVTKRAE